MPRGDYNRKKKFGDLVKRKKLIDIKEDFYYLNPLENIHKVYWNQKVWIHTEFKGSPLRIDTNKRLRDFLNERFILYQLRQLRLRPIPIIESIEMTKREVWYYIEILSKKANTDLDGNYIGFVISIKDYCETIKEKIGVPYWGYVLDDLKIKAKARATIYEEDEEIEDLWLPIGLDKDTLKKYTEAPFFLILCEKEGVITAFLKELLKRGYDKKYFYCINLGGESPTNAIRLIREYLNIKNFHVFVLHDMDMSGLEIFFDVKRHFKCKSIGVNPNFLEHHEYDFNKLSEAYRSKTTGKESYRVSEKLVSKTITILNQLDITIEEKETYNKWIEMCIEKRVELNSITAHKIESDPSVSKVNDFVNYFIYILEETNWNLTRIRPLKKKKKNWDGRNIWTIKSKIPRLDGYPDFINEFDEDIIEDKINEEHKDYLDVIKEIGNIITTNTENIEEELEKLTNTEEEDIDNEIEEIKETYPNIFEGVDWGEALDNKYPNMLKKLNNLIKMSEKQVRFNNIKKHIKLTKQLKNYIGSIKEDAPENAIKTKENELQIHISRYSGKREANKRRDKYDKVLQRNLKKTPEYKELMINITNLDEELEERQKKEDNRLEFLEKFKIRIEKNHTELIDDLNEFNSKNND